MPDELRLWPWMICLLAVGLASCSTGNSTRLHELEPPKSVMSSAEQDRAIKEMLARKDSHQTKAIEEIGKTK